MESTLQLEIVTPDKVVVSQEVDYIGVPGAEGEFGILPHHIPLLSALRIGCLYYRVGGTTTFLFISGGFAEVSGNSVSILAESAEPGCNIDVQRANAARERAAKRLQSHDTSVDVLRAEAALQRAINRLRIANPH